MSNRSVHPVGNSRMFPGNTRGFAGDGGLKYIFRDLFKGSIAAGDINDTLPTITTLGIKRRNTLPTIAINNLLTLTQTLTQWFGYTAITRQAGLMLFFKLKKTNEGTTTGYFGFSFTINPASSGAFADRALRYVRYGTHHELQLFDGTRSIRLWRFSIIKTNISYDYMIVLRATGSYYLMSGNGVTPSSSIAKMLYVINTRNDATLYPSIGYGDSQLESSEISLIDLTQSKWGTDTIFTDKKATVNINDTITHTKEAIIEFTYTSATDDVMELSFKYTDDNNHMFVEFNQAAGTIKLKKTFLGFTEELKSYNAAAISANGTVQRYLVYADINETRIYCNNIQITGDEYFKFLSGSYVAKVNKAGTNLISYPIYVNKLTGNNYIYNHVDRAYAGNSETFLDIETYDGSDQALHPDVIYVAEGWNGYKYWMGMTPYPALDLTYENPSVMVSNNGIDWIVPPGGSNPITPKPPTALQADSELIMIDSILYYFYTVNYGGEPQHTKIVYKSSTDGITWSAEVLYCDYNETKIGATLGIIHDGDNYRIYGIDHSREKIMCTTLSDLINEDLTGKTVDCNIPYPTGYTPWHLNAMYKDGVIYVLWIPTEGYNGLYLSISRDGGLTWETSTQPFLRNKTGAWDNGIYRSAMVNIDNVWHLWYSSIDGVGTNTRIAHTIAHLDF